MCAIDYGRVQVGGALLALIGFRSAVASMAVALFFVWIGSLLSLKRDLGKAKHKPKFRDIFSKSRAVNILWAHGSSCLVLATCGSSWRGRSPGVAGLGLLVGRCVPGILGDRLWHRAIYRACFYRQAQRSVAGRKSRVRLGCSLQ
jgi:hypothetical protein